MIFIHPVSALVTTLYVDPTSQTVSASFTIDINVTNVSDLYGWEFKLNYSTAILTATSVIEGSFLTPAPPPDHYLWISCGGDWIYKTEIEDPTTAIKSWDTGTSNPMGVEWYDGYVYYVDTDDNLYKMTEDGGSVTSWDLGGFSGDPYGLGCNGTHFAIADKIDDDVYFTTVGAPGTQVGSFVIDQDTEGFCWKDGYWYGVSSKEDRVAKYYAYGGQVTTYALHSDIGSSTGITWDGTYWWISDDGDNLVYKLTQSDLEGGTYTTSYDTPASDDQGLDYLKVVHPPRNTFFYVKELNDTIGRVWVTCTVTGDVPGVTGSGDLATISFDTDASGASNLDLHDTKLVGYNFTGDKTIYNITHTAVDGTVTITGVPEFPLGAAMEIALVTVIVYVWWRRKRKKPKKLFANTVPHPKTS